MKIVSILIEFIAALFKAFLGERSRDEAQQVSGQAASEHAITKAAAERAENAKQVSKDVAGDSDDELDERMRDNRTKYNAVRTRSKTD